LYNNIIITLVSALIDLAKEAAGCDPVDKEAEAWVNCTETINGFKPTSLATGMATIGAFIAAFLSPVIGAIIDHTSFRWNIGMWTGVLIFLGNFFQCFISSKVWLAVAIIQIIQSVVYIVHLVPTFAYIPELTNDSHKMGRYNASFNIVQYLFMLIQLVFCAGISYSAKLNEIELARYSQVFVTCIIGIFFTFSWGYRLGRVETKAQLEDGQSVLFIGFIRTWKSIVLCTKKHRHIIWFYLAIAFSDAAVISVQVIIITLSKFLGMGLVEFVLVQVIVIISSFPGSKVIVLMIDKFNPKRAMQVSLIWWIFTMFIAGLILTGPERKHYIFYVGVGVGLGFGMHYPAMRTTFTNIVPKNQEAEFMGMYLFFTQSLIWLPTLIFTVMNEGDIPMNYGVMSLCIFLSLSFICLLLVGSLENARNHKIIWENEENNGTMNA